MQVRAKSGKGVTRIGPWGHHAGVSFPQPGVPAPLRAPQIVEGVMRAMFIFSENITEIRLLLCIEQLKIKLYFRW